MIITTVAPTVFVIFGATGDLAKRKLLASLFRLYAHGRLPEPFRVVGFARGELSTAEFRDFVHEIIAAQESDPVREKFLQTLTYQQGLFEEGRAYLQLSEELIRIENTEFKQCSNKLFYLAAHPRYYDAIFKNLAHSGLTIPCGGEAGWTRVLVEKPFGHNLATAQQLDTQLGLLFKEEQIFRIDHYLAKETLQNILAFRFSNSIFELLWNNENIAKVELRMREAAGVEERGEFYQDVGALRDVGQNHLLQMLALIAMDDPGKLSAARIRRGRAAVLQDLRMLTGEDVARHTIRGQYAGYRQEHSVPKDSDTETYFRIRAFIDNPRWRGVPFYLESGKKLHESTVEIEVHFRECVTCLTHLKGESQHHNLLTFRIQPDEGISLVFWAKKPGFEMALEPKVLAFSYGEAGKEAERPDAYERVLYDCIRGDQTLFASTDEVSAAWRFITPILEDWRGQPLVTYEPGSRGLRLPKYARQATPVTPQSE